MIATSEQQWTGFEWGVEPSNHGHGLMGHTRCGHGHGTVREAENCLATANERMCSPGNSLMNTKVAAVSTAGDTRDLTDAECATSYSSELIPTPAAPELGM